MGPALEFRQLSYANPAQPRVKRWLIQSVEGLSGRNKYLSIYESWRSHVFPARERVFGRMLEMAGIGLSIEGAWPPKDLPAGPVVIVANHPFGIGDGIAILSLAEQLGRPFKVLVNDELLKIEEMRDYALPISFEETKTALATNLKTRQEALSFLKEGGAIAVFPAGGVATAPKGFGRAEDLPWKLFTAKLVQSAKASVIPLQFHGQNGRLFHLASKISLTLRLSLLVREFKLLCGKTISVRFGSVMPWAELAALDDRKLLLQRLQSAVFPASGSTARRGKLRFLRRGQTLH